MGVPYPYLLYVHCGARSAYFDGRYWIGNPPHERPPSWDSLYEPGMMELLEKDVAKFQTRSGDVIFFRPLAEGEEYPWLPCL